MSKQALVISKEDFYNRIIKMDFDELSSINIQTQDTEFFHGQTKANLADRSTCETDESLLQIIPYITLVDSEKDLIFVYTRGEAGNENRLHGKVSIGLGGHIEDNVDESTTLLDVITNTIVKEIKEEIDYDIPEVDIIDLKLYLTGVSRLIYTNNDNVGKVHLGISVIMDFDSSSLINLEHGVITKGEWIDIFLFSKILSGEEIVDYQLEEWSKLVGQSLIEDVEELYNIRI